MGAAEARGPELDLRRRARLLRWLRLAMVAFVVAYFFLPYEIQSLIPPWLPFLAAVYLEAHFFVGGYLQARQGVDWASGTSDRGPQPRDLAELGGEAWRETTTIYIGGERHYVPIQGLTTEDEVQERIAAYVADPDAMVESRRPFRAARRRGLFGRRYLGEALATLALVGGILFWASRPHGWDAVSAADRARAEAVFSREAAKIAGHEANVRCDTNGDYVGVTRDADGLAYVGGSRAYLTPTICDTLYQLAFKHRTQSFPRTGRAIAVLAHEAWHLQGVAGEGLANCYAFQRGVAVGEALGLSEGTARSMMRQQLATNASDAATAPEYLVPAGCHNGGTHDLDPGSDAFP